ncbi:helix-turn-helix transcriptional regulator [Mucilaginibacter agri]|uniref:WYL domain-containing protein n=1 Tax=Mucilaginibacter agri TaxID=2695265 RepID=A0A966DSW2_9SPHI|nr:YafY family protein [Mucilaginibacter agri]NCD68756.1 WYL domain-containing protein [Mucilaginibacter agri]
MNRIDRISAILIQLQSRKTVKASDIADRFSISLRTVYRDIKTLEEAGIPIIGEAGVGYSLVDGYRLPPVMFTRDEAAAFLTAEKLVEKLTDSANSEIYRSAMYKIKAVLRSTDKDYLETIDNHIEILKSRTHQEIRDINPLQNILQSIAEKRVLSMCYKAAYKEDAITREIEPVGVFYLDSNWHLIAFCRLRVDYRDFRFDRMENLEVTSQHFTKKHAPLQTHLENLYKGTDLVNIVIRIKRDSAAYVGQQKYYHGFVSEKIKGDEVEMQFLTPYIEGFTRWFMMYADRAKIIEPTRVKDKLKQMIDKISENI